MLVVPNTLYNPSSKKKKKEKHKSTADTNFSKITPCARGTTLARSMKLKRVENVLKHSSVVLMQKIIIIENENASAPRQ